jgi:hypothetical protein
MNEIYVRYKETFDNILEKYIPRHERWKWYFDQESFGGDRCETVSLCDRFSEFDFLENFTVEQRDSAILYYAIDAWEDMRQYAIKNRPDEEYICHICLCEEDYIDEPILWPALIFEKAITDEILQDYKESIKKPESEFAKYIITLLRKLGQCKGAMLRETIIPEKDRLDPNVETYRVCLDFVTLETEKRIALPGHTISETGI